MGDIGTHRDLDVWKEGMERKRSRDVIHCQLGGGTH